MTDAPDPIDWPFAERVAHRVAGHDLLSTSYHRTSLDRDFADATARAADLVAQFTGLQPRVDVALGQVVDRQEWVTLNLASFRRILRPVTERLGSRVGTGAVAGVGRRVAGAEAGVLLGWFGRRVLGQYDLLGAPAVGVPTDGRDADRSTSSEGAVYYVGPNVLGLEKRFGFQPAAFRLWIALHEVTHLVQFTGVPWMRDYFLSLIDESLRLLDPDPKRFARAIGHVVEELRAGRNPLEGGGLVTLFADERQRELLARIQALMSVLEGHGNYVMDRLGADHVEGKDHMAKVLRERRVAGGASRQVQKALGIELKLKQYATGEAFFDAVEREAGDGALAALWRSPDALPTLAEIHAPTAWLTRIGAPTA
ncbi:MAG TPA: zinc-dependent metalloprotease [Acidimicrobiia bacterium]|nr:zinc-dependent metalloprotease [Acidimicrobiia bacterium]